MTESETDIYALCDATEPTAAEVSARPPNAHSVVGITLTELGKRCGWAIPHQAAWKMANGRRNVTPDKGQEIADATGHPVTVRVGRSLITMIPDACNARGVPPVKPSSRRSRRIVPHQKRYVSGSSGATYEIAKVIGDRVTVILDGKSVELDRSDVSSDSIAN